MRNIGLQPRVALQAQGQAHLGEDVLVVVQAGAVHAQRCSRTGRQQPGHRGDAGAQAQVRTGVVADRGAGLQKDLDVRLGQPDPVRDRKAGPEHAEVAQVGERRGAVVPGPVQLFVKGLPQMGLDARVVARRARGDVLQKGVGHPGRPGRAVPDIDGGMVAVALPEVIHDAQIVARVDVVRRRQEAFGQGPEVFRQCGHEGLILTFPVDQMAAVAQARRKGHADAGLGVGLQAFVDARRIGWRPAAPALHLDHAGDAATQQLAGAQEAVQIGIQRPQARVRQNPGLQQHVGQPLLQGRDRARMMVRVDQARDHGRPVGAEDRRLGTARAQIGPGPAGRHPALFHQQRAVVQHRLVRAGDHPTSAYQHLLAHGSSCPARAPGNREISLMHFEVR